MRFRSTSVFSALALLVLVTGCATHTAPPTVSMTGKKEVGYTDKLQRVVLVSTGEQANRTNVGPLITSKLKEKGVFVEMVVVDPLELNKGQSVRNAIARIGATHVFVVEPGPFHKRVTTSGPIRNTDATELIDTQIQALSLGKVVWRGRNVLTYTRTDSNEREDAVATAILKQLVADSLLSP